MVNNSLRKLVWENTSELSTFAEQDITLPGGYDYYEIITTVSSNIVFPNEICNVSCVAPSSSEVRGSGYINGRRFGLNEDGTILHAYGGYAGYTSSSSGQITQNDRTSIPKLIYGYKK